MRIVCLDADLCQVLAHVIGITEVLGAPRFENN